MASRPQAALGTKRRSAAYKRVAGRDSLFGLRRLHTGVRSSDEVTPQAVRRGYLGGEEGSVGLISFFNQHNAEFESMVGLNRSKSTLYKYRYVCNHLRNYIIQRYNRTDISLQKVNRTFVCDFHRWLAEA